MFGFLKSKGTEALNKATGRIDVLEAGFAIAARAAAADGTVEESEIIAAIEAAQSIDTLRGVYTPQQLEEAAMKQFNRAKSIMGRNQLKNEIGDIANKDNDTKTNAFMIGAMAADAVGGIGPEEKASLLDSAKILGLSNAQELLAA